MSQNLIKIVRQNMEHSPYRSIGHMERNYSLIKIVQEVVENNIDGDFVECGVAEGMSCAVMAYTLKNLNNSEKTIWMYDTYEGTSVQRGGFDYPSDHDISHTGLKATDMWDNKILDKYATPLDNVKNKMAGTKYEKLNFIEGRVEDTIPEQMPETISILRLDTDFYYSTKHELEHLYPKLQSGGYLIIDDYGHWQGCKKAVNEYMGDKVKDFHQVDYTCVVYKKK